MLIPQGVIVKRSDFEALQQRVAALEKKLAELLAKQPERKVFRREVANG